MPEQSLHVVQRDAILALQVDGYQLVVVFRSLEVEDRAAGDWLVTTIVDRDTFDSYRRAELSGLRKCPGDSGSGLAGSALGVRERPRSPRDQQPWIKGGYDDYPCLAEASWLR